MMVLGDFSGQADETPLEERRPVSVDKNTFASVLKDMDLERDIEVTALKGPLGNMPAFRKALGELVEDDDKRTALLSELEATSGE